MQDDDSSASRHVSRRQLLGVGASLGVASTAGCFGLLQTPDPDDSSKSIPALSDWRGSGSLVDGRPAPGGTSIQDLPDLSGELTVYIGGGEGGLYGTLVDFLEQIYPEFSVKLDTVNSSSYAQTLVDEVGVGVPSADVFWPIDVSPLAFVANESAYEPLSDDVAEMVGNDQFVGSDNAWAGVAGRARSVPYNTNQLSASDIPNKVADFPETDRLRGNMGWAPTYPAFKAFVTAMRLQRGNSATRNWLNAMQDADTQLYGNEYLVSDEVARGNLGAGFANHYYAMRVQNDRPNAPIKLAFTEGDAGALVNVAGVVKPKGTEQSDLADTFVRHLLSAEAQEYFATRTFAYPMISGVSPVGDLPPIDELSPPSIDLAELENIQATLDLMQRADVPV